MFCLAVLCVLIVALLPHCLFPCASLLHCEFFQDKDCMYFRMVTGVNRETCYRSRDELIIAWIKVVMMMEVKFFCWPPLPTS